MKNIFLVGYMGVGKTTIGRKLANKLKIPFYDLDEAIEKESNTSVKSIFEQFGEGYFRQKEQQLLKNRTWNGVLSTGGGAPMYFDNMDWMCQNGVVVYLKMEPKMLYSRLSQNKKERPLITHLRDSELLEFIKSHLEERDPVYKKAQIHWSANKNNTEQVSELADQIKYALGDSLQST